MNWVIAVVCFGVLAILWKRSKPKWLWIIAVILAAFGGAAFFATAVGGWVTGVMAGFLGWVGGWFGATATLMAGAIALITVVVVILDVLADRNASRGALLGLILLPMLFVIASGPVAAGGTTFYDAVNRAATSSVGRLVGG